MVDVHWGKLGCFFLYKYVVLLGQMFFVLFFFGPAHFSGSTVCCCVTIFNVLSGVILQRVLACIYVPNFFGSSLLDCWLAFMVCFSGLFVDFKCFSGQTDG